MDWFYRAFAGRASLAILIFLFLLLPQATIDGTWASGTDIPGPLSQEMTYKMFVDSKDAGKGFTLIAPYNQNKVNLINRTGTVVHTWQSDRKSMGTVVLLDNGTLLRGRSGSSGKPVGVHLLDWDGTVLWDYTPPEGYVWHHDVDPMPNGNILITTMASYTYDQVVGMGRDPALTMASLTVDPILEIKPNGTTGGDVVWMWNPLDHLVQDYDHEKSNYGVVEDHPELIDFNYPAERVVDWQHANAVAYNAELDQVMMTLNSIDEIWVVDHSTTTEEAAGHSGGALGKGGDLLYRWGNAQAYGAGNATNHILYGPHDAHWIGPGLPGEGNIIIFNNGVNSYATRPEGRFSSVEELVPPVNATGGYDLVPGSAYGPAKALHRFTASPPGNLFANAMGGVERLPDGGTLVCGGSTGYNFEVNTKNEVVWEYRSQAVFQGSRYYPPAIAKDWGLNATEDVTLRVDASTFISDPDTDREDLALDVESPYASVTGHELQLLYPDGITTDVINLTVSDGIFAVGRTVRVNITPVNDPPRLSPIPEIGAIEAVPYILDLDPYLSDPDTDTDMMTIAVDSSFVTVAGGDLRFLYPDGVLTDRVLLTVSDGEFEVETTILVNVKPVNDPPTVDRIPDQHGVEDVPWTIDLGTHVRDVDSPIESITVASDSPYASITGLSLTLLYPDGVTMDIVRLNVSDGADTTLVRLNVTIAPVNDPPVIGDIQPVTVTEDVPFPLDLDPAISDIDTPRENLTLRVDSPFIQVNGHSLTLLYPDGPLHDEVVVEVWDGELLATTTLVVDVEPVNDAPVIGNLQPVTITEDVPFPLDLGPLISDVDTPPDGLTLRVDSPFIQVDGRTLTLLYPDGPLHDEVTVEVWDGELLASTTLVVDVEPVNDPPWWAPLPEVTAVEDVAGELDLGPYMMDVDTPIGQLAVEVDSSYGSLEGRVFRFIYPNGVLSETVNFTLTDGEFRVVLRVNVTVTPVNDAPELSGASVDPPGGGAGTPFIFTVVFRDIDMGSNVPVVEVVVDGKKYRCAMDDLSAGRYDEGVVFHLETDLGPGTHLFFFTADDGDGGTVTGETLFVVVKEKPHELALTPIMISLVIIVAVALVAILQIRKRGSPGTQV